MRSRLAMATGIGGLLGIAGLATGIAAAGGGGSHAPKTVTVRPAVATPRGPDTEPAAPASVGRPTVDPARTLNATSAASTSTHTQEQVGPSGDEPEQEKGEVEHEGDGESEAGQPGEPSRGHEDGPGDAQHECTGDCVE